MRIKEGQMLELKNGQKIGAEEEIERFANLLVASGLAYYLLFPKNFERDRALVADKGADKGVDVVRHIAREMYEKSVKMDEMVSEIFDKTDLSEDEKEAFLQGLKESYAKKMEEAKHE